MTPSPPIAPPSSSKPDAAHFHSNLILAMHYHPGYDQRAIREECRRWNDRHAEPLRPEHPATYQPPDPERRLRIGYVSPEFRDHVDGLLMAPLLSNHDHRHFEIFCYAQVAQPDALTERLRGHADVWRDTVGSPTSRWPTWCATTGSTSSST